MMEFSEHREAARKERMAEAKKLQAAFGSGDGSHTLRCDAGGPVPFEARKQSDEAVGQACRMEDGDMSRQTKPTGSEGSNQYGDQQPDQAQERKAAQLTCTPRPPSVLRLASHGPLAYDSVDERKFEYPNAVERRVRNDSFADIFGRGTFGETPANQPRHSKNYYTTRMQHSPCVTPAGKPSGTLVCHAAPMPYGNAEELEPAYNPAIRASNRNNRENGGNPLTGEGYPNETLGQGGRRLFSQTRRNSDGLW